MRPEQQIGFVKCLMALLLCVSAQQLAVGDGVPELPIIEYPLNQINPDFRGLASETDRHGMVYFSDTSGIVRFDGSRWRQISTEAAHSLVGNLDGDIYASNKHRRIIFRFATNVTQTAEVVNLSEQLTAAGLPARRLTDFRDHTRVGSDVYMTQTWFIARFRRTAGGKDDIKVFKRTDVLPPHLKFRRVFQVQGKPMVQLENMKSMLDTQFGWLNEDGSVDIVNDLKIPRHVVACAELNPESPEVEFYAASVGRLNRIRPGSVEDVTPEYVQNLDKGRIISLTPMKHGGAVAELAPKGILALDAQGKTWAKLPDSIPLSQNRCTVDSLNRIWVANRHHVARANTDPENRSFALPDQNEVISLASTKGYLLVASENNAFYAKTDPDPVRPIGDILPIPVGGDAGNVRVACIGEEVFVLNWDGVWQWDPKEPEKEAVRLTKQSATHLAQLGPLKLVTGCNSTPQPMQELIGGPGKWAVCRHLETEDYTTLQFLVDTRGDVWASQHQFAKGARGLRIAEDGTFQMFPPQGKFFEFENEVRAFSVTTGVLRFDRSIKEFVADREFQQMLNTDVGGAMTNIHQIRSTDSGVRICNEHSALWRVERIQGQLRAFRLPQQTGISETADEYGRLWRSIGGKLTVGPDGTTLTESEDNMVAFAEVTLSNAGSVDIESADRSTRSGSTGARQALPLSRAVLWKDSTEFNVSAETLNIGLSVPLSAKPEATLLTTRMLGIDDHWSEPSFQNQFQFPALPGGQYTFEAKAMLPSGNWSKPSQLHITVHPKFYQTIAFTVFAVFSTLGLITAFSVFSIRQERNRVSNLREVVRKQEETERQLIDSQAELIRRERLQAFGVLAASITHDINNLLTPILSYASILAEDKKLDPGMTREFSQTIATCATDAAEIIARLTPTYRLTAAANESCNLEAILADVAELLRTTASQYQRKNIEFVVATTPAKVWGVPTELREVLINLGNNACDAIENEGIVQLRCRTEGSDVIVEVEDNGVGMSEELLKNCTDTFFSSKGEYGTGLGLATSTVIVASYGGSLTMDSSPGTGTTVRLKLPAESQTSAVRPIARSVSAPEANLSIVLVDDIESTRTAIKFLLGSFGHSVTDFSRAIYAIEYLQQHPDCQLLLTDHQMPDMDGFELCQTVRRQYPEIATILMSGYERFGAQECCDLFLNKPVSSTDLRDAISQVNNAHARSI